MAEEEDDSARPTEEWLLTSLSEAVDAEAMPTLRLDHPWGDVRVEATDTDRIHVTAIAQSHRDDPRKPSIRWVPGEVMVGFAELELVEDEAWAPRRIDIGLLVPQDLEIEIVTRAGAIEAKKATAPLRVSSTEGDIVYNGSGPISAHSERGAVRAMLRRTGADLDVELSTLTGDVWCILLEGARAQIALETRGPVTTDFSVEIERATGSPLKHGTIQLGEAGSATTSSIILKSYSGGIRVQNLIVPEGD
ncbi:MAG: hypothetical protein AAGD38_22885 [Acidobacteriota bacterium]